MQIACFQLCFVMKKGNMVKTSALVLTNLLTLSALAQAEDVLVPAQTNLPVNQPERVQADALNAV